MFAISSESVFILMCSVWKGFYPFVFDFEYPVSVTDPYPNAQKLHFYNVDIHYNFIWQKLTISIFEHKYENKYDISNICSYPIRLHLYSTIRVRHSDNH